jgi:hypothetical protein
MTKILCKKFGFSASVIERSNPLGVGMYLFLIRNESCYLRDGKLLDKRAANVGKFRPPKLQ